MFGLFTPRCSVCGKVLGSAIIRRTVQGATTRVCPCCDEILRLRESSAEFRQGVEFATFRRKDNGCSLALTILAFFATLAFGVALLSLLFSSSPLPQTLPRITTAPAPSMEQPPAVAPSPPPIKPPAGNRPAPSPKETATPAAPLTHRLLRRRESNPGELSLEVEVPLVDRRLPSREELEEVVSRLTQTEPPGRRTVVVFYLPGMILGGGGFATGRRDSGIRVELQLARLRAYPRYQRLAPAAPPPAIFPTENRTWRKVDGGGLVGRIVDLNEDARTVTVVLPDGRRLEDFRLDQLHPDDRAFILRLRR